MNIIQILSLVKDNIPQEITYNKGGERTWSCEVDYEYLSRLLGMKVTENNGNLYFDDLRVVSVRVCPRTIDFTTASYCDRKFLAGLTEKALESNDGVLQTIRYVRDGLAFDVLVPHDGKVTIYLHNKEMDKIVSEIEDQLDISLGEVIDGNISGTEPGQISSVYRLSINGSGKCRLDHKVKFWGFYGDPDDDYDD